MDIYEPKVLFPGLPHGFETDKKPNEYKTQ